MLVRVFGQLLLLPGDLLVGLHGLHVTAVEEVIGRRGPFLRVQVESPVRVEGCRICGVVMRSHGRRNVRLIDTPCFGRPVELTWRKRTWRCAEPDCPAGVLTEQNDTIARLRALLSTRACWWVIGQIRREHASVLGLARQLGTTWRTVWRAVEPLLQKMAARLASRVEQARPGRRAGAQGVHRDGRSFP